MLGTLLLSISRSGSRHANQRPGGADKLAWQWSAKERNGYEFLLNTDLGEIRSRHWEKGKKSKKDILVCLERGNAEILRIFTCGSDGDARVWSDFENDDPTSYRVGEIATAVCVHENTMFVSDENGFINSFELPTGVKIESVCKFTLPVNHMEISVNGRYLLACSSDFKLKLIDLDDGNTQILFGLDDNLTHPFCSVAIDPKIRHIAASSCDGSVKVWVISKPAKAVAALKILPKFNDISLTRPLSRLQFEPNDGQILAVPVGNSVNLYSSDSWGLKKELKVVSSINEVQSAIVFV
uniref:WDHD1 first WD40 domain-containing protein n=1 Tax=Romanomermis culicivorax TaxID=13658 RepID=A0A915HK72_ROMCU